MSNLSEEEFYVKRNRFVDIIMNSTQQMQRIYSRKEDLVQNVLSYGCERERLLTTLDDYARLYSDCESLFTNDHVEVRFGKSFIDAALKILESLPERIVSRQTVIAVPLPEIRIAEHISPHAVETVVPKVKKLSRACVNVVCRPCVRIANVFESVSLSDPKIVVGNSLQKASYKFGQTFCLLVADIETKNSFESSRTDEIKDVSCDQELVISSEKVSEQTEGIGDFMKRLKFVKRSRNLYIIESYQRIVLRFFWTYFLFNEFNLCLIFCSIFDLILSVFGKVHNYSLYLVKNAALDGEECNCRIAVVLYIFMLI
ncbi:uncharacterized protein [Clytia hemisphaerica]|uniref:uncharacterized protein n=1 Tax=Clytia hemisphaerica TaxID=252671 RepID=UPI0034D639E4